MTIELLLSSPLHRYEGRPALGPRDAISREVHDEIEIRAGLGVVGDRHFGTLAHRTASVTVMAIESLEHIASVLNVAQVDAAGTRRNIIIRGLAIDEMRGEEFTIDSGAGAVRLVAHRPANPCAWMDVALAPGAHRALKGRGGMRCEPLTSGTLRLGPAVATRAVASTEPLF